MGTRLKSRKEKHFILGGYLTKIMYIARAKFEIFWESSFWVLGQWSRLSDQRSNFRYELHCLSLQDVWNYHPEISLLYFFAVALRDKHKWLACDPSVNVILFKNLSIYSDNLSIYSRQFFVNLFRQFVNSRQILSIYFYNLSIYFRQIFVNLFQQFVNLGQLTTNHCPAVYFISVVFVFYYLLRV